MQASPLNASHLVPALGFPFIKTKIGQLICYYLRGSGKYLSIFYKSRLMGLKESFK